MERRKAEQVAVARCLAKCNAIRKWRWHPEREDLVSDADSHAWQIAMAAPLDADPRAICRFALLRVTSKRLLAPPLEFEPSTIDPAQHTQFNLDLRTWLETLPDLHRAVALRLALGYRPGEIAAETGYAPSRISKVRAALRRSWREFRQD